MSIRCLLGLHAERVLWGMTPSPTKDSFPKWIWECPRCENKRYSGSPRDSRVAVREATQ